MNISEQKKKIREKHECNKYTLHIFTMFTIYKLKKKMEKNFKTF